MAVRKRRVARVGSVKAGRKVRRGSHGRGRRGMAEVALGGKKAKRGSSRRKRTSRRTRRAARR